MKRSLFLVESRRTTVQVATLTVATLLVLLVVEIAMVRSGGRKASDVRGVVDLIALGAAVIAGLVIGVQTFGGEARRRELEFLAALPMARSTMFALVVAARIAAVAAGFLILVVLRPWLLARPVGFPWLPRELDQTTPVTLAAVACLVLLAAGMCVGAIFRRASVGYAVIVPAIVVAAVETIVGSGAEGLPAWAIWTRIVAFVAGLSTVAWWHVRRGEFDLRSNRLRGMAALAASFLAFVGIFQRQPFGASIPESGTWQSSPEACRMVKAVWLGTDRLRVTVFDTRTGHRLGRFTVPAWKQFRIAPDGSAIWVLGARHWPSRVLDLTVPRSDAAYCWVRGDRTEGPMELPSDFVRALEPLPRARALAAARDDAGTRLVELDGATRTVRPLLMTPLIGLESFQALGDRCVFTVAPLRSDQKGRRWLISDAARELDADVQGPPEFAAYTLANGRYYPDRQILASELLARFPGEVDRLVLPRLLDETHGSVFGVRSEGGGTTVSLYALDRATGRWTPVDRNVIEQASTILPDLGVAIYAKNAGPQDVIAAFDARTGRHVELAALPHGGRAPDVSHEIERGVSVAASPDERRWFASLDLILRATGDGQISRWTAFGDRIAGTLQSRRIAYGERFVMVDVEGNVVRMDRERRVLVLTRADGVEVDLPD